MSKKELVPIYLLVYDIVIFSKYLTILLLKIL